jgi:DNA-binding MarR family transcriptional regulator
MAKEGVADAEVVLERFVETMFKLIIDHHQKQVIEMDLTMPQAQVLKMLRSGALCTGQIATQLAISAPAVTQLTDRLTRKRLIERRADAADRRSVMLVLTNRGRRAVDTFRERRNDVFCGALANLSSEDRESVVLALGKIVSALETYQTQTASRPRKASNSSQGRRISEGSGEVRNRTGVQGT